MPRLSHHSPLLLLVLLLLSCSDPPATPAPKSEPGDGPVAAAPPAPEAEKPPYDFLEARRFSPDHYDAILKKMIPVDEAIQDATGAFLKTTLAAIERDFFEDDTFYRSGAIVLLGESKGRIVALTQRYFSDITYPDLKLLPDGMGTAEIGPQYLDVFDDFAACRAKPPQNCRKHRFQIVRRQPESNAINAVEAQAFDDHDIALLYFHKDAPIVSGRRTLGLANPEQAIDRHVRDAEQLFGFKFVLISTMAFGEMKSRIEVHSVGDQLIASAATMVLGPIVQKLVAQVAFPPDIMAKIQGSAKEFAGSQAAKLGQALVEKAESTLAGPASHRVESVDTLRAKHVETGAKLADSILTSQGEFAFQRSGKESAVAGLGLVPPAAGDQADAMTNYLSKVIPGAELTIAKFAKTEGKAHAMLMVPEEHLNLNYELLRHGLVRLAVDDERALRSYPELVEAAQQALDAGTGFARDWKQDGDYVATVQRMKEI